MPRPDGPARLPIDALRRDALSDFAPALPPGCSLAGRFRHVLLNSDAQAVFVTATSDGRALLSLAAGVDTSFDGGSVIVNDAATWILERNDDAPRWFRGPMEPSTTSAVGFGISGLLRIAWARGGEPPGDDGVVRAATFSVTPGDPAVQTLGTGLDPFVSDLACEAARCVLAWGFRARDDSEHPERAAFTLLASEAPRLAPPGAHPLNAIVPAGDDLIGSISHAEGRALVPEQAHVPVVRIPGSVLEIARIRGTLYAVTASAPGTQRCQPGAWTIELARLDPSGALREAHVIATTDARPRGVRLRALGPSGEPMVSWLDAPQCADRFFVVRAWRNGRSTAVATASEYDVATEGRSLSLAWRERDRIRWAIAQCLDVN